MDEKGVLTIECSLVFPLCIFFILLIIGITITSYERSNEVLIENCDIIKLYEKSDEEINIKYDKDKNIRYSAIFNSYNNGKYNAKRNENYKREYIIEKMNNI